VRDEGGSSLPAFATTLVGRDRDVEELAKRLGSARLLTLTGPAGIGKTRLAVEACTRVASGRRTFVDLAPLRDERLVAQRVANAFGVGELRGRALSSVLDEALTDDTLLVLDNCEHVVRACAGVARELLAGCRRVRMLATSQQRLGVPAEEEWVVSPLEVPGPGAGVAPEAFSAVQLFRERATAAHRDFLAGRRDVEAIVDICRRLDANPLAIELAAARVRTLSPTEIAARLQQRFHILRSGTGATEGRYESLAAAMDWSYDLLSEPEKALLRRLSVFAGTFGFPAVQQVCSGGDVDPDDVLELLSGVIAKSLVRADTSSPAARYHLAETVRLYAAQRLTDAGEDARVGERHAEWCMGIVEHATRVGGQVTLPELEAEADNLRSALDWCVRHERGELGLRLATGQMLAWEATGHLNEARDWLQQLLAIRQGVGPSLQARALYHAAFAALLLGDFDNARRDAEASLAASAEAADLPSVTARTKGLLGMVRTLGEGPAGTDELERSLEEARAGDAPNLPEALVGCGHARLFRGEPVAAEAHFEELVALARRRGLPGPLATGLVGAGAAALAQGEYLRAGERLREGTGVATATTDPHTHVIGMIWLAELARVTGELDVARNQLEEWLTRVRPMGSPYPLALGLLCAGRVALDLGDADAARGVLQEALEVAGHAPLGHLEAAALQGLAEAALALREGASADALFERALAAAQRCSEKTATARISYQLAERARARGDLEQALSLHHEALQQFHAAGARPGVADGLDAIGGLGVEGDDLAYAARLLGSAAAMRAAGGWGRPARAQDPYPRDLARLRERMRAQDFEEAWAAGGSLSVAEAVAYASRGRGRRTRATEGPDSLTRTEREVVALAVEGLTIDEIAGRLFVSPRTVHSHLRRVYAKLGVGSRRELRERVGGGRTRA
jgi:predicted ATPase/DNA-binding CsgD family transcriptional regulator